MNRTQVNRARIAQRASVSRNNNGPATNPAARLTPSAPGGNVRNRSAVRLTRTQRDSEGRRSDWSASPYYFTDPKWDQTVSSQHIGEAGYR